MTSESFDREVGGRNVHASLLWQEFREDGRSVRVSGFRDYVVATVEETDSLDDGAHALIFRETCSSTSYSTNRGLPRASTPSRLLTASDDSG